MKRFFSTKPVPLLLIGIAVMLISGCSVYAWLRMQGNADTTPQSDVVTYSTDKPSEEKPGDTYAWQGSAQDPKKIVIPEIGVNAYIQKVGVDQHQQIAVPNNLFMVGWFVKTVRPGETGLSVIDGHVTGRKNDGVFKNLGKLKPGDRYTIQYGDNSTKQFEVMKLQSVPVDQAVSVLFSQEPSTKSQLNLITCSGKFNTKTLQYDERLIVSSRLVN